MDARLAGADARAEGSLTVGEVIDKYLRHADAEGVHGPAQQQDRVMVLGLFKAARGHVPVADARPFHLTDFIADQPGWRSSATRRSKASTVKAAFNWAVRQGRLGRNPFASVQYEDRERRPDLSDADFERICALAAKPFEQAIRFLRLVGCRSSEMCRLTWDQVDLDLGVWLIDKHKNRRKTKKPRVAALVPEVVAMLRGIAAARAVRPAGGETIPLPEQHVFLNCRGTPWNKDTLLQYLDRLKERHGITTPASVVGIRHRYGTSAAANGAPPKLAAAQMGNSVRTFERYYCDLTHEMEAIREAAKLAAKIGERRPKTA